MKQTIKLFVISVVMLTFSAATFAQATATATASATIVTPLVINKTVDLNFGNLYVSPLTGGTAVVTPGGVRSQTLGVGLAPGGTVAAASFTVTGTAGAVYTITLPTADHAISNGTQQMVVNTFLSSPAATGTLTGGTSTLTVGATLNVAAAQATGLYTSVTPFNVTVNYQ